MFTGKDSSQVDLYKRKKKKKLSSVVLPWKNNSKGKWSLSVDRNCLCFSQNRQSLFVTHSYSLSGHPDRIPSVVKIEKFSS